MYSKEFHIIFFILFRTDRKTHTLSWYLLLTCKMYMLCDWANGNAIAHYAVTRTTFSTLHRHACPATGIHVICRITRVHNKPEYSYTCCVNYADIFDAGITKILSSYKGCPGNCIKVTEDRYRSWLPEKKIPSLFFYFFVFFFFNAALKILGLRSEHVDKDEWRCN